MSKKKRREQEKNLSFMEAMQRQMPEAMLHSMFALLMGSGISALLSFPAQAGYGPVATVVFQMAMAIILSWAAVKFFKDMAIFHRC